MDLNKLFHNLEINKPTLKITLPGNGDMPLRCGGCGGMGWQIHVSKGFNGPKISEIGCVNSQCQKVFKIEDSTVMCNEGRIDGLKEA